MRRTTLIITFTAILLTGCATPDSVTTQEGINNRIKVLDTRFNEKNALLFVVPSADNAISNTLMLATIKTGQQTNAVKELTAFLKKDGERSIAVTGDHDGIAAATLDAAMDNLQEKSSAKVFFIGDSSYGPDLKKKADTLGIQFGLVPYPSVP